MTAEIYMPQLGLTMTEGKVVRWLKAAGDPVRKGEPVLEIETDKVTAEIEAPADGVLGPILVEVGANVPIGGGLSHVVTAEEQGSRGAEGQRSGGAEERRGRGAEAQGSGGAAEQRSASLGDRPSGTLFPGEAKSLLPERLVATPRARRKASELGIDLAQVEPSGPGGRIVEADVRWHFDRKKDRQPEGEPVRASPLARRLAEDMRVDLARVRGSGPGGRIVEDDVRRASAATRPLPPSPALPRSPAPMPPVPGIAGHALEPLSGIRRVVAERMTHSFTTAPHFYLSAEVEATALVRLREGLRPKVEAATGARLTVTDILLKVCAQTLAEFPEVNVAWAEDVPGGGLLHQAEINVGLAVSLDAGLVVPVLRGADRLTLGEIARRRTELVERAREGKLSLGDLDGGTFTLSNLGMYGVDQFQAILNPPQSAILAVGRIKDRPVAADGSVVVRPTIHLTLSVDHRALDGAQAARFLERAAQLIQEPYLLLE